MNPDIDRDAPRPLELRVRDVSADNVSVASAARFQRTACDFMFVVLGLRDRGPDGGEVTSLVTSSLDGRTRAPLGVDALYNMWISLAGEIVHAADESPEALKIRRFCKVVLERVRLDENLQRLAAEKALHPERSEREIVAEMTAPPRPDETLR